MSRHLNKIVRIIPTTTSGTPRMVAMSAALLRRRSEVLGIAFDGLDEDSGLS